MFQGFKHENYFLEFVKKEKRKDGVFLRKIKIIL